MFLKSGVFLAPGTIHDAFNKRMNAQKGTFAIPGNSIGKNEITNIIPFENEGSYEEIIVPFEFQVSIRNELKKRGYTTKQLYGTDEKSINYPKLRKDSFHEIMPKFIEKGLYKQYSVVVESDELMTLDEIDAMSYKQAVSSQAESIWIWYRRRGASLGNNIVTQHWFTPRLENIYGWHGECQHGNFKLERNYLDGFISYEYFIKTSNIKFKHLQVNPDAKEVFLEVSIDKNSLIIDTNLLKGTGLSITYQLDNKASYSSDLTIKSQISRIAIKSNFNKITGTVALSPFQTDIVKEIYGIDYENLKGDFINRSNSEASVRGYKKFNFNK